MCVCFSFYAAAENVFLPNEAIPSADMFKDKAARKLNLLIFFFCCGGALGGRLLMGGTDFLVSIITAGKGN